MASSTIIASARPADFNSTHRNGGENIWASALAAASIIACILSSGCVGLARRAQPHLPSDLVF
jgi:hypothetical protein